MKLITCGIRFHAEAYVAFRIVEEKFHVISKSRVSILKLQLLHELALHRYVFFGIRGIRVHVK